MNKTIRFTLPAVLAGACLAALLVGLGGMARAEPLIWMPAATIPEPRAANLVQCVDDPQGFYLVGGITSGNVTVGTLYYYNAATNAWDEPLASMPEPLRAVGAACYEGKIYVAGGWEYGDVKNTLYIYNIAMNSWSQGADLPDDVWAAHMGAWDGKLYLAGGFRGDVNLPPVDRVDVYDIATNTWTAGGGEPMLVATGFAASNQMGPYLYIAGGIVGDGIHLHDSTQGFNMATNVWELGPNLTTPQGLGGLAISESRLYISGGSDSINPWNALDKVDYLELADWPGGAWTVLGDPLPQANLYPAPACTEAMTGGEIWAVGGTDEYINVYDSNLYRPAEACYDFYFGNLAPESLEGEGYRGGSATYELTLTNDGTLTDTYDLVISGNTWPTDAPVMIGPLAAGESAQVEVNVEIPIDTPFGASDSATLTVTSQGEPSMEDTALITTTAVTDWEEAAELPQETGGYGFAQCPDDPDSFYVMGGADTPPVVWLSDLQRYDAGTDTWTTLSPMPVALFGPAATCYQGKIYVAGGFLSYAVDYLNIYDIASDTWTSGAQIPRFVSGAALGAWAGKLYLVGGLPGPFPVPPVPYVDIYDIETDTWSFNAGEPMPIASAYSGWKQAGAYLYIVGGFSGDYDNNVNATQRYDLSANMWLSAESGFPSQRAGSALAVTQEYLYAMGGDANGGGNADPTTVVERLNLSDWPEGSWEMIFDPLPTPAQANWGGFCTEAMLGGEVWSTGGFTVRDYTYYSLDSNLYRPAEPCLSYDFSPMLAPELQNRQGDPGSTETYELVLTNAGDTPDAFDLAVSSNWTVTVSGLQGALVAGDSVTLTVDVHIPADAMPYEIDTAVITATSQGNPAQVDSSILTTTANPRYDLELEVDPTELTGMPGEAVTFSVQISNQGNITDTYDLDCLGDEWPMDMPFTQVTLAAGESADVDVIVHIPLQAMPGQQDAMTFSAVSQGDPAVTRSEELMTTVIGNLFYLPVIVR